MLLAGQIVAGRFRLGPLLGRGGMADVYRAVDQTTDEPVAVKLLRGVEPSDLRRFAAEAQVLEQLDHPGIVRLIDTGDHEGVPYLVLDCIEGTTLASEIATGPLPTERAVEIASVVAGALTHAHARGVVHRDIKPDNILLAEDGSAHLSDFGVARLAGSTSLTATGAIVGTAGYLSPEQVRGRPAGPPSDVYALGLVLLESLTGQRAFAGNGLEAGMARLTEAPRIPDTLPSWIIELVTAMTAIDPVSRPDAAQVRNALRDHSAAFVESATVEIAYGTTSVFPTTAPAPTPPPILDIARRPAARRWGVALALVAGLLLVGLVLGALANDGDGLPANLPEPTPTSTVPTTTSIITTTTTAPAPPPAPPPRKKGKGKKKHDD